MPWKTTTITNIPFRCSLMVSSSQPNRFKKKGTWHKCAEQIVKNVAFKVKHNKNMPDSASRKPGYHSSPKKVIKYKSIGLILLSNKLFSFDHLYVILLQSYLPSSQWAAPANPFIRRTSCLPHSFPFIFFSWGQDCLLS